MTPRIRIARIPYEDQYHLRLVMLAGSARQHAEIEFYVSSKDLLAWAEHLEVFPRHKSDVFLWERGSERSEDGFAYYIRFRVFIFDGSGHCAVQLRFNNNQDLPDREIAEFCITAEPSQINRLGRLCREFAALKHEVLDWWLDDVCLYERRDEVP
jgi:hypothetical protein